MIDDRSPEQTPPLPPLPPPPPPGAADVARFFAATALGVVSGVGSTYECGRCGALVRAAARQAHADHHERFG